MQSIYKSRFIDVVLIVSSLYSIYFIFHKFSGGKVPFWDFHVYYCSAKTFFLGNFPYGLNIHGDCLNPNISLSANFSPVSLEILKYIGYFDILSAQILWILFEIISIFTVFFVMKELFKFDYEWRNFFIFVFSFGGTIFISFLSGNISVIICGFLSLGIYFLYKKFFTYYYLIVVFVSLFKFYYLSFLIIPFYLLGWKSLNKIFLCVISFILIQYFFYINNPNLTIAFIDIVQGNYQDMLPVRMQTGTGLYSIIEKMPLVFLGSSNFNESFFSLEVNLIIWLLICSIILLSIFYCLHHKTIKRSRHFFLYSVSLGILSIDLIIPRLVVYDLIFTIPIFFYLLNQINFKKFKINIFNPKYFFIFLFFVLFDHHFPFFIVITFLTLFIYSEFYKKKYFIY